MILHNWAASRNGEWVDPSTCSGEFTNNLETIHIDGYSCQEGEFIYRGEILRLGHPNGAFAARFSDPESKLYRNVMRYKLLNGEYQPI